MSYYLCKAKTKLSGTWVKGYYVKLEDRTAELELHLIVDPSGTIDKYGYDTHDYEIDPITLCRCTGIPYGDDFIWEDDIFWDPYEEENVAVEWFEDGFMLSYQGVITYNLASAANYLQRVGNKFDGIEED